MKERTNEIKRKLFIIEKKNIYDRKLKKKFKVTTHFV